MTANGFVELVKARNAMAKSLGYLDYYDYKVTQAEGFGKVNCLDTGWSRCWLGVAEV